MATNNKDFIVKNGLIVGDSTNLVNYTSSSPSDPFVGQLWIDLDEDFPAEDPNLYLTSACAAALYMPISASNNFLLIGNTVNHANTASSINWSGVTAKPNLVNSVTGGSGITIGGTAADPTVSLNSGASVSWGNVSSKPSPIVGISLTGAITGAASVTLTDLTNGQISVTTSYGAISTNAQTGTSYTLALSDAGKIIEMNNAAANLVIIPLNSTAAFPTGTKIDIIQTGAGATSASIVSGVTLNSEAGKRTVNAQWQAASLVKRGTDTWVMIGAIKT